MVKIAIDQFTLKDEFIKTFSSSTEAGKELRIDPRRISENVNGKKPNAGDFIFKKANDDDLLNEKWQTGKFADTDVSFSDYGRIWVKNNVKTYGTSFVKGDNKLKTIYIKGKHYNVGEIILTIYSDEVRPEGYFLKHKNNKRDDNTPQNLYWCINSMDNCTIDYEQMVQTKSREVCLIKSDSEGKPCYDNGKEIILREYLSSKEASDKSIEHVGTKIHIDSIHNVCNGRQKKTGRSLNLIYRYKDTYTSQDDEIWKKKIEFVDLENLPESYNGKLGDKFMVSSYGNIKDQFGKISGMNTGTKFYIRPDGYCEFNTLFVHRIVAYAFKLNPEGKLTVDHINRNKTDNHKDNLEWATHSENNLNRSNNIIQKEAKKID